MTEAKTVCHQPPSPPHADFSALAPDRWMGSKIVVFGLSISSSWGNGHATIWRGLCRALAGRGHRVVFFERDVPYYAEHRDKSEFEEIRLRLYADWEQVLPDAQKELSGADAAIVTSYCPDAVAAADLVRSWGGINVFYDLDTPVTLQRFKSGEPVFYIGPRLLQDFDLVLSYTGGRALLELRTCLGAKRVFPLYGSVDPDVHHPVPVMEDYRADLSYLGTYAEDRQAALQALFIEPAKRLPERRFLIGGSLYPPAVFNLERPGTHLQCVSRSQLQQCPASPLMRWEIHRLCR
jgi:spore maturation protein CgeB